MKEKKYIHISGTDSLEISVLRMEPDDANEIKGIVQLVHGMNEYKERYLDFIKFLVNFGYLCVIHDHRGHGESIKNKDDLGFMYEGGYEALIEDTHEITLETKKYAKEITGKDSLPFTLLGHSMGSLVVRCYIRKYDSDIDKLVVLGSPSPKSGMKMGLSFVVFWKKLFGERKRSPFITSLVMGDFDKKFKKEGPGAWVNSDPEEVAKYRSDPLCMYHFTMNGYENLIRLTILTYTDGGYAMNNPDLPIRFFSGAGDPCAIDIKHFEDAIELIKKQGYKNVSGKMYEGMRHEILNEPKKQVPYEEILSFIEKG
ncbi:MAG: lysophospholipase [Lachnospiraceae bacterium]|nr:lysophospholipase [Lachnospiraceae bacterium]